MDMVRLTNMSQSQVSQTLQKLKLCGMVAAERHGTSIHYKIKCVQLKELLKQIESIYPVFKQHPNK
jgi:DNA-binding transcriptional ArsR family regulator